MNGASPLYDGNLHLRQGDPLIVWVTDTDYADVTVDIELAAGVPPALVLGAVTYGTGVCRWPEPVGTRLMAMRSRNVVTLMSDGGPQSTSCGIDAGRVRVGLRASSDGDSTVARLDLTR
jgi:hypothetical protein